MYIYTAMADQIRDVETLRSKFSFEIRDLIKYIGEKSKSDTTVANIDRLKSRISLLRKTMGEQEYEQYILHEAAPFFIQYSDHILERNISFFTDMDIRAEVAKYRAPTKADDFMFALVESVRSLYNSCKPLDRDTMYARVVSMHTICAEYTYQMS